MSHSADFVWRDLIEDLAKCGEDVRPRGILCKELMGYQTIVDMRRPIVTDRSRKLGYKFMLTEAAWIIKGQNDLKTLEEVNPNIRAFSDDGITLSGAYGPRLDPQVTWVTNALVRDNDTRQAVASIWRPRPEASKDLPCTTSVQLLLRKDSEGVPRLNLVDTMRSSDAWLGWPYDVFSFSMFAAFIALRLREQDGRLNNIQLGNLYLNAGSQHIYTEAKDKSKLPYDYNDVLRILVTEPSEVDYAPLDLVDLKIKSQDFGQWLLDIRDGKCEDWLSDLREKTWGRPK